MVPPGTRVYAIGDSHGCLGQMVALHEAIYEDSARADAAEREAQRRVVVYLGDYVDRGPDSRGLVDLLVEKPLSGFEAIHLMGNHDHFLRQFLAGEDVMSLWLMNGAGPTLRSYGIDPVGPAEDLRTALRQRLPAAHLAFFDGLVLSHMEGDYVFVHAGIRPGVPLDAQDPQDLLWIREPFLDSMADHGKIVVHGHTPTGSPEFFAHRIGIDTGACYGGHLTALGLEGKDRWLLQVQG